MEAYVPGKQINEPDIIKLNTNENPFPASESVVRALTEEIQSGRIQKYPDPGSSVLRNAVAKAMDTDPSCVLIGNGSDELLSIIFRSTLDKGDNVVYSRPSYSLYPVLAKLAGAEAVEVEVNSDWSQDLEGMLRFASGTTPVGFFTPGAKLSVIVNPNAMTGVLEKNEAILDYAYRNQGLTLVDEAYIAFGGSSLSSLAGTERFPRLMVTGTFSKSHSLAGQRVGWLLAHPDLIREFDKVRDSYNVSRLGQVAALAALQDNQTFSERIREIIDTRTYLEEELKKLDFEVVPSSANFVMAKPPAHIRSSGNREHAARLYTDFLEKNRILTRYFSGNPRTVEYVRISIGSRSDIEALLSKTKEFLETWKSSP